MRDSNSPEVPDEAWMLEVQQAIEQLAAAQAQIQLIQEIGKRTNQLEQWAILMLRQLQEMRSGSDRLTRRIILDMVEARIISQHQAAKASGFSRMSIHNWLKDVDKASP